MWLWWIKVELEKHLFVLIICSHFKVPHTEHTRYDRLCGNYGTNKNKTLFYACPQVRYKIIEGTDT